MWVLRAHGTVRYSLFYPELRTQTVLPQFVSLRLVVVEITRPHHMLADVLYLWVSCVRIRTRLIEKMCSPRPAPPHLTPILYPAHFLRSAACVRSSSAAASQLLARLLLLPNVGAVCGSLLFSHFEPKWAIARKPLF